jgi:hypothetical protein
MWEYIIPIIVFLITSISIFKLKKDDEERKIYAVVCAGITSIIAFLIIKFKDHFSTQETMMPGTYFD